MKKKIRSLARISVLLAAVCAPMVVQAQSLPEPVLDGEIIGTPELVERACREGKVNYYSGQAGADEQEILKAFEEHFPCIKVSVVSVNTSRMYERILNESAAGQPTADAVLMTDMVVAAELRKKDMLRQWTPPSAEKYPDSAKSGGWWYAGSSTLVHPVYNTELVSKEDAPKTWNDLLSPKFAGQFGTAVVNAGGPGWLQFAFFKEVMGEDYFKRLAELKPQFHPTFAPVTLAIARQELMVGVVPSLNEYPVRVTQKAPIAPVYPPEGVPFVLYPLMLFKESPNPAAGELLANYYLSHVGQGHLVRVRGAYSARKDVASAPGNPNIADLNLWNLSLERTVEIYQDVFGITDRYFPR